MASSKHLPVKSDPGLPEVLNDFKLFDQKDDLKRAIKNILSNPEHRTEHGALNRKAIALLRSIHGGETLLLNIEMMMNEDPRVQGAGLHEAVALQKTDLGVTEEDIETKEFIVDYGIYRTERYDKEEEKE